MREKERARERDGDACFSRRVGGGGEGWREWKAECGLLSSEWKSIFVEGSVADSSMRFLRRFAFPYVFRRSPPMRRPCPPLPFFSLSSTCILSNLNFWKSIFPKDLNLIYIYIYLNYKNNKDRINNKYLFLNFENTCLIRL